MDLRFNNVESGFVECGRESREGESWRGRKESEGQAALLTVALLFLSGSLTRGKNDPRDGCD